jgi:hypothetical protein
MGKKIVLLLSVTLFALTLPLAGCSKKEETVVNPPPPPPAPAAPAPAGPEGQPGAAGPEGKAGAPGADAPMEKKEEGKTK